MLIRLISLTGRHKMDAKVLIFIAIAVFTISFGQEFPDDDDLNPEDASNDLASTDMKVSIVVDDRMTLFADGKFVGRNRAYNLIETFRIPSGTKLVAVRARNIGGPRGILASFDGGRLVTDDKRWRCSGKAGRGWRTETYDDSDWPLAKTIQYKGGFIPRINSLTEVAKWIWTGSRENMVVFCRAYLDITGYIRVDDSMKMFADGKFIGATKNYVEIKSFEIPGRTRVIAIKGKNIGGPHGIRASFGGKQLITSNMGRWRCVSRFAKYWTQPTFNDNAWPVAKISRGPSRRKSSIDASAKWIWGRRSQKLAYCRAFLSMFASVQVDDRMKVYADGIFIGSNRVYHRGMRYRMPGQTQLVAIEGKSIGGAYGIRGFFAAGRLVTDTTWKCINSEVPNWNTLGFDDSTWPNAIISSKTPQRRTGVDVTEHDSKWIWAVASTKTAYCRGFIRKVPGFAAAVTGMKDTQLQGNTAAMGQVDSNLGSQENEVSQNTAGSNSVGIGHVMNDVVGANARQVFKKKRPTNGQFDYGSKQSGKKNDKVHAI